MKTNKDRSIQFVLDHEGGYVDYTYEYWNAVHGDDLPAGVDLMTMDWGVDSGPHQAIIGLQRSVGVADDGIIGPKTLAAVRGANTRNLLRVYCNERMRFYRGLSTFPTFGWGWTNRALECLDSAIELLSPAHPIVDTRAKAIDVLTEAIDTLDQLKAELEKLESRTRRAGDSGR